MQNPMSPGHSNSQTSAESDGPDKLPLSVNLDVIMVPSGFLGKWYISVHAILNAVRAGETVPAKWILTDGVSAPTVAGTVVVETPGCGDGKAESSAADKIGSGLRELTFSPQTDRKGSLGFESRKNSRRPSSHALEANFILSM